MEYVLKKEMKGRIEKNRLTRETRQIIPYIAYEERIVFTFERQLENRSGKLSPKNTISSR